MTQTNIFIGFDAIANQNVDLMSSSDVNEDWLVFFFSFFYFFIENRCNWFYYLTHTVPPNLFISYDMSSELVKIETSQRSRCVFFISFPTITVVALDSRAMIVNLERNPGN